VFLPVVYACNEPALLGLPSPGLIVMHGKRRHVSDTPSFDRVTELHASVTHADSKTPIYMRELEAQVTEADC
jgi:hypothetical protein